MQSAPWCSDIFELDATDNACYCSPAACMPLHGAALSANISANMASDFYYGRYYLMTFRYDS